MINMGDKIHDTFLFLSTFFLIFSFIPKPLQLNFIFGGFALKLSVPILFIAAIWSLYEYWKTHKIFPSWPKTVKWYLSIYFFILIFSLAVGLSFYPYYDQVLNGPKNQIENLSIIYVMVHSIGIPVTYDGLLSLWMFARPVKGIILEILYTVGFSYMIYSWYRDNWYRGIKIMICAVLCGMSVVSLYGILDVFFLAGSPTATHLLESINPLVHVIKQNGTTYPPLLWPGQLRSVFAEPSYFGIYAAFALPWMWYAFVKSKTWGQQFGVVALIFWFSFCLFLTNARTSLLLFIGEMALLLLFSLYFYKYLIHKTLVIILLSLMAFCGTNLFMSNLMVNKAYWQSQSSISEKEGKSVMDVEKYVADNVTSAGKENQRSNNTRLNFIKTDIKLGLSHPVLGVGSFLRSAYYPDYLPNDAFSNKEIQRVLHYQKTMGIMKFGMARLGEYTTRLAETGILGLLVFLFPFGYLGKKLGANLLQKNMPDEDRIMYAFFTISFIGVLASWLSDSMYIIYSMWILLPLGYAMCRVKL